MQATAHVHYLIPDIDGPQVLLEYNWSEENQDLPTKPMLLSNVGTEAFGVQIHNVQRGKWKAKFPKLDVIRRDSPPIPIQPTIEYDGHAFPVQEHNFISLLKQENGIEQKTEVNLSGHPRPRICNAWNRIKGYVLRAFGREYLVR